MLHLTVSGVFTTWVSFWTHSAIYHIKNISRQQLLPLNSATEIQQLKLLFMPSSPLTWTATVVFCLGCQTKPCTHTHTQAAVCCMYVSPPVLCTVSRLSVSLKILTYPPIHCSTVPTGLSSLHLILNSMFLSEILSMNHTGLQSFGDTSIADFVVVIVISIVISIIETRLTTLSGLVTRLDLTR